VSGRATVERDETVRLFLALLLPSHVEAEISAWAGHHLSGDRRMRASAFRRLESFHVTLAFLGSRPRRELPGIVGVLRDAARAAAPFTLEPERYRETRSVAMLVLRDPSGAATRLADGVHTGLQALGVYEPGRRPWLPHVTVLRFRERPRLSPPLPEIEAFAPSGAAAFLSRLHPSGAGYEVLESCSLGK